MNIAVQEVEKHGLGNRKAHAHVPIDTITAVKKSVNVKP
jgi:hypothetical protein